MRPKSNLWVLLLKSVCYTMFVCSQWPLCPIIRKWCEQGWETGRRFPESVADLQAWGVCMKGSSKSQSSALIFIVRGRKERRESHEMLSASQGNKAIQHNSYITTWSSFFFKKIYVWCICGVFFFFFLRNGNKKLSFLWSMVYGKLLYSFDTRNWNELTTDAEWGVLKSNMRLPLFFSLLFLCQKLRNHVEFQIIWLVPIPNCCLLLCNFRCILKTIL